MGPLVKLSYLLVSLIAISQVRGLSLRGEKCGQLTCDLLEFCNPDDNRCSPCSRICDDDNHNYDLTLCDTKCQIYLHDMRYIRRDEGNGIPGNDDIASTMILQSRINSLQNKVSASIIIISIAFVLLLVFLGVKTYYCVKLNYDKLSWAWLRGKILSPKKTPKKATAEAPEVKKVEGPSPANADVLPLSARALQAGASPPRRQPAEDASLDFSYDNMALNLTSSPSTPPYPQHQI